MFAQISVKHTRNDKLSHVSLSLNRYVLKQVSIFAVEHYLKCSSEVMLFQDLSVTVSDREWMLSPYDELICVARVLVIVDQICNEAGEDIRKLKERLQVG